MEHSPTYNLASVAKELEHDTNVMTKAMVVREKAKTPPNVQDEERDVQQSPQNNGDARSIDTPATFVGLSIKHDDVASEDSSMTEDSVYTSSDEEEEKEDDDSAGTENLLMMANIRLCQQELTEEVKNLKGMLTVKDEQLLQLTSQLRRATASKCDLVNAVTDMEREREKIEQAGEAQMEGIKKDYLKMLEGRADMEREFMNELTTLSEQMMNMDRRHKNQLLEKDFTIAKLEEELRKFKSEQVAKAFVGKSVRKVGNVTKV